MLNAAAEAFAAHGPGVPVHEIARLAGVGTGTVSRHFPTKEALVRAIVLSRVEAIVAEGERYAARYEPGQALFAFVGYLVERGAADMSLANAVAGAGIDVTASAGEWEDLFMRTLGGLLTAAQQAGAVRPDIRPTDIKALVAGCMSADTPAARARLVEVVTAGIRPARRP